MCSGAVPTPVCTYCPSFQRETGIFSLFMRINVLANGGGLKLRSSSIIIRSLSSDICGKLLCDFRGSTHACTRMHTHTRCHSTTRNRVTVKKRSLHSMVRKHLTRQQPIHSPAPMYACTLMHTCISINLVDFA